MNDDAERIRRALDNPRGLAEALGLLDGRHGRDWMKQASGVMIRCLWHDEHTPSCSITRGPDGSARVRCFGCGASGDGLTLVAAAEHLDLRAEFRKVLEAAASIAGVSPPESLERSAYVCRARTMQRTPTPEPVDEFPSVTDDIAAVLAEVAPITRDDAAMSYLRSRGLDGGAARNWYALPELNARGSIIEAIVAEVGLDGWVASGLSSAEDPSRWSYAWDARRVVIPWRSPYGVVEALQGRAFGRMAEGTRKYSFGRGRPPRWPYGVDGLGGIGPDTAIASVEGAIDAESFNALARAAGADSYALAIPGTASWRDEWLSIFARRPCLIAFDPDDSGNKAAAEVQPKFRAVARRGERGPMVSRVVPRGGVHDWNEALKGVA